MSRVLVIEDNEQLALGLRRGLESDGHEVEVVHDGARAMGRIRTTRAELVILDLMLPGVDGFALLRHLRDAGTQIPVLILSARGEDVDKIQGFRLGADDYVVKPVGLVELLFRVRAILRRVAKPEFRVGVDVDDRHRVGDVDVDLGARTVTRDGVQLELTRLEFDLLACLIRHRGRAVARETLLAEVWRVPQPERLRTRTIDTHIGSLRAKIEPDSSRPSLIITVRKIGYRLTHA